MATEAERAYQAAWYQKNKAKKDAQQKAWREANIERAREITRDCEKRRRDVLALAEGREIGRIGRPPLFTSEEQKAKRNEKAKNWYRNASVELTDAYRERARLREQAKRDGTFESNALPRLTEAERKLRACQDFHKRRAYIKANGGKWTKADIMRLLEDQNGLCAICNEPFGADGFHIDHWKPLSRGGTNDPSNLKLTHPVCNLKKGTRLPDNLLVTE